MINVSEYWIVRTYPCPAYFLKRFPFSSISSVNCQDRTLSSKRHRISEEKKIVSIRVEWIE